MTKDLRGDDYIDSRDVIKRHEELKEELRAEFESRDAANEDATDEQFEEWVAYVSGSTDETLEDEATEYIELVKLIDQAEGYGDWSHGATLIREDKFDDYAQNLAEETEMIDRKSSLYYYVDWSKWADDVKQDYTEVEFNGVTYLMRC